MSQLQEIEKLYAKKKTIKIPREPTKGQDQAELEVKPLALDEMACFDMKDDMPMDVMADKAIDMLSYTLGCSKEEAGKIQFSHMMELLDVIVEINELPEEQKNKMDKVKQFMETKNKQTIPTKDEPKQDKPLEE